MTELEQYIKLYFGIQQNNLSQLADFFKSTTLQKGDFYVLEGKKCPHLSFIKSGYLRIFANYDGKEITQWISSEGEFVTEINSLLFDSPSRWSIQALTDCELHTISQADYLLINKTIPDWDTIEKLFLAKCFGIVENRVFSFLALSAEERYLQLFDRNKGLFNQIPLQYLASMLGMSPETLSRIRKKLTS